MSYLIFQTPVSFATQLAAGDAIRYGTLIKDATSGRILAHVQETGMLQSLISQVSPASFSPLGIVSTVLDANTSVQLDKLLGMTQMVANISLAGLGVGLAGIGVSMAGTRLLLERIQRLEKQIQGVERVVTKGFEAQERREHDRLFAAARTAVEHGRTLAALQFTADSKSWVELSLKLNAISNEAAACVDRLQSNKDEKIYLDLFESLLMAHLICKSGAIQALVRANEVPAAQGLSRNTNAEYRQRFDVLDPAQLIRRQLMNEPINVLKMRETAVRTRGLLASLRKHVQQARQRELLLSSMALRKIDGAEYVQRLEQEEKLPLLLVTL